MVAEQLMKHVAKAKVTRDVVVLFMIHKKYNLDLLSLLVLYEMFGKDVFVFFYVLSNPSSAPLIGKTLDDLEFGPKIKEIPKESNLKLMFTKARKVADALRRNSSFGLTSVTLPWYNILKEMCVKTNNDLYIDFYVNDSKEEEENHEPKRRSIQSSHATNPFVHR